MGLIRKQARVDLKTKIEEWIKTNPTLNEYTRYCWFDITPDYAIETNHTCMLRSILLAKEEIPDYIIFDFSGCGVVTFDLPWSCEEIVKNLNKYDKHVIGVDKYTIMISAWEYYDFQKDESGKWRVTDYFNLFDQSKNHNISWD